MLCVRMKPHEPTFDIFRGAMASKDATWVEAVSGLAAARERMNAIAAKEPGRYFLFSSLSRSVLAMADTTP